MGLRSAVLPANAELRYKVLVQLRSKSNNLFVIILIYAPLGGIPFLTFPGQFKFRPLRLRWGELTSLYLSSNENQIVSKRAKINNECACCR